MCSFSCALSLLTEAHGEPFPLHAHPRIDASGEHSEEQRTARIEKVHENTRRLWPQDVR